MSATDYSIQLPDESGLGQQAAALIEAFQTLYAAGQIEDGEQRALAMEDGMLAVVEIVAEQTAQVLGMIKYANIINAALSDANETIDELAEENVALEYENQERVEQLRHAERKVITQIANGIMRHYGVTREHALRMSEGIAGMGLEHDLLDSVDAFFESIVHDMAG